MKNRRALISGVILIAFPAFVAAQSLADVARKAEEQRNAVAAAREAEKTDDGKGEKPAKWDFTDTDLENASSRGLTVAAAPAPVTIAPAAGGATPVIPTAMTSQTEGERQAEYAVVARKDEAYWKERMAMLRGKLRDDQAFLAVATTREHDLDQQLHVSVDNIRYIRDPLQRAEVEHQWQDAVTELKRLQALAENDTAAISRAEEEARRAGVPAGWLRP